MCGINGLISRNPNIDILSNINRMNSQIIHRGPDDKGVFCKETNTFSVGMGMRRLSIIDINSGNQPIFSDDRSISIVFNGEIYNYLDLKNKLLNDSSIKFQTNSDTEVILKLYEKYGSNSFKMLDGMFAFSIFDSNKNKIIIARDFFGEKPLYYTMTEDTFFWASELKSIVAVSNKKLEISKDSLATYFQLTYIPEPNTIYKNVYKLKADHYISINTTDLNYDLFKIERDPVPNKYSKINFNTAKEKTFDLIMNSSKSRSVSDVPIGTFLSGGVDSSIISFCLAKQSSLPIDTFSIGFENKLFDETDKSNIVAKLIQSKHHKFIISLENMNEKINDLILNYDEPFADSSAIPTYILSKKTKKHVKVALTGDGGDEMFGGYNKYYIGKINKKYTNIVPYNIHPYILHLGKKLLKSTYDDRGVKYKIKRVLESINYDKEFYFNIISLGFNHSELGYLLKDKLLKFEYLSSIKKLDSDNLYQYRKTDKIVSLEGDLLVKVDRASMLNSLECRSPFLNREIWNFTNQLPEEYLIKGWNKKYLLKETFNDYFPKNFLYKSKKGFQIPIGDWLRTIFKKELMSYIDSGFLKKQNIFNINYISKIVIDHIDGRVDNSFKVWTFYCFQKWYKKIYLMI